MLPVFITPEGALLSNDKTPTPPTPDVEEAEPLHVIAARAAEQQSTKKKVSE